ncbi:MULTISPECIES: hypothetical protein [unclassified Streptomyces]|uniref:hypothetical protein n=1 Tax=unclassified Streptomyces TaxID=2593676 RepID=UPI003660B5D2
MTEALIHEAVHTPSGMGRGAALDSVKPVTLAAGLLTGTAVLASVSDSGRATRYV